MGFPCPPLRTAVKSGNWSPYTEYMRLRRTDKKYVVRLTAAIFILWSVGGLVLGQTVPEFEDVPEGHMAKTAIEWAATNGITVGVGGNRFGIGQTLIRYQVVTFLCRAFDPNACLSGTKGSVTFADVPVDHWANYSIGWAVENEITSGVSDTEFGGSLTLTREQMITFLFRAAGSPTGGSKGSDVYEDVPDDRSQWANLPIGWAFNQGISGGIATGVFGFGKTLSREEMVLLLCRAVAPTVCAPSHAPISLGASGGSTSAVSKDCDFTDHVTRVSQAVYQVHAGSGIGTAFYIGNDEWLTAAHVVNDQSSVTLRRGGVSLAASVLGTDVGGDLAILRASGSGVQPLGFGKLSDIGPGHPVFSVGFPLNVAFEPSVTSGVLSRIESDPNLGTVVVTDAALNPGNSGGPLVNNCGEVIGLVVAKIVGEEVEGIGYAVAESTVRQRLPDLREGESAGEEGNTGSSSTGDTGQWVYFVAENLEGSMEGYHLTAIEHDGNTWEAYPLLILRCGISNSANNAIFILTDWLIQSAIDADGDVVMEYRSASMTTSIAEWWWSDEDFESTVVAYEDTTEFITQLSSTGTGSVWVRIWDGFDNETYTMRFEMDGIEAVLSDLGCW